MTAKPWRFQVVLFLCLWAGLLIAGRDRLLRDPGTFWHTRVGQQMLATGQVVRTDSFSFTKSGEPWLARQWLSECAMAWLDNVGKLDSLLVAAVTLLAGLYAWLGARLRDRGLPPGLAVCVIVLTIGASTHHFHARPHLVTLLGMAVTFALLCDFESNRRSLGSLFWLVPLFVVWTNAHDGVLGGIATVGVTVVGWMVEFVIGRRGDSTGTLRQLWGLIALGVLCAAMSLVNPYGLEMPRAWLSLMDSPVLPHVMAEHGPLWSAPGKWLVLLLAATYLAALFAVPWRQWRVTWWVPMVWLVLSWGRVRHAPLFAITAAVALADLLPQVPWVRRMMDGVEDGGSRMEDRAGRFATDRTSRAVASLGLPAAVLAAALMVQAVGWQAPLIGRGWATLDADYWPTELLTDLRQIERERPDGTPIFNDMLFGGFLIYHTPRFRVFIDDRCELYGDAGLLNYVEASARHPERIDEWADRFGFDLALTERGSGFDEHLSKSDAWNVVRRSATGTLYRRPAIGSP